MKVSDLLGEPDAAVSPLTPREAREWALWCVAQGWAVTAGPGVDVYGVCACHRRNSCTNAGKHAHSGWGDKDRRVMTAEHVAEWWSDRNWSAGEVVDNVFIVPYLSGLVAADVDDMTAWEAAGVERPETLCAVSGSGRGRHYLYRLSWDVSGPPPRLYGRLPGGAGEVRFRAVIVAPPSLHKSGGRYVWVDPLTPVADAPEWLRRERPESTWVPPAEMKDMPGWAIRALLTVDLEDARRVGRLQKGDARPTVLYAVACKLGAWAAAGYVSVDEVEDILLTAARENGSLEDYGDEDIERQIRNGLRTGGVG